MMSFSFKLFLAFGVCLNQLMVCLLADGDRVYTISFTTGTNGNDGTAHPVYFKIYGVNGDSTEWFKYDSFPSLGTKYEFNRCLNDIGEIESIDMVRKSEDHSTPAQVSVDHLSYTYTYKYAYVACRRMNVDFIEQTYTQYNDASYCRDIDDDIIDDKETCFTSEPSGKPTPSPTEGRYILPPSDYRHKDFTWLEAMSYCEDTFGTTLATVNNMEELLELSEFALALRDENDPDDSEGVKYWIGLSDLDTDGTWHWTDGRENDWDNWNFESKFRYRNNYYCGQARYRLSTGITSATSIDCEQTRYFVCDGRA